MKYILACLALTFACVASGAPKPNHHPNNPHPNNHPTNHHPNPCPSPHYYPYVQVRPYSPAPVVIVVPPPAHVQHWIVSNPNSRPLFVIYLDGYVQSVFIDGNAASIYAEQSSKYKLDVVTNYYYRVSQNGTDVSFVDAHGQRVQYFLTGNVR